ncbi:Chitinase-1 [Hyphodiscus hymeniophilus]|uniref:chitinase n=1 Tax=Hyphodiscus hymeniophilus TaxID=353542 RepID=A0A9P6VIF4_9HELO|nr:Chitinase-1 [Hyphodiscus hymeniophilus]
MRLFYILPLIMAQLSYATKYVMYLTGQHNVVPSPALVSHITHVELAFMPPSLFNQEDPSEFPLFTDVETVRSQFAPGTKVMVAIGGWGDTEGFSRAAASEGGRDLFARNVGAMVEVTGADGLMVRVGVDIDWEYPGGNGEDYKQISNSEKAWEIEAYPLLLSSIRSALGPSKLMSAAVPGLRRDMLAFTNTTIPLIDSSLDFFNVMTYDLMNRRDNVTKHHTGLTLSSDATDAYLSNGIPAEKANLGFAFYVKWFRTAPNSGCDVHPIGCKTALLEDPLTGGDLGRAGQFAWCDAIPDELQESFGKAMKWGRYDAGGGGTFFWDREEGLFWSWEAEFGIGKKMEEILEQRGLGGVFAWGLGEDGNEWRHLRALNMAYEEYEMRKGTTKDEL